MNILFCMVVLLPTFRQIPAKSCTSAPSLEIYETGGITENIIKLIVDYHNKIRNKLASGNFQCADGTLPKSSNMLIMSWDNTLAKSAQAHSDYCIADRFDPAQSFEIPGPPLPYGQNIYFDASFSNSSESMNWTATIGAWESGSKKLYKDLVPSFKEKGGRNTFLNDFTQMIWAKTSKIGCGYTKAPTTDHLYSHLPYSGYYTCNYLVGGNVESKPIYDTGDSCSKCHKSRCDSKYTNLCS